MNNISYKRWAIRTVICIISILVFCAVIVTIFDPFFQYHKPLKGLVYEYEDAMYEGAGIVKNFDYEIVIAGTSLIQNMKTSYAEELFGSKAVKVSFCGMSPKCALEALEAAVKSKNKVNRVIMNIDEDFLTNDAMENFPEYLYDRNVFNDVDYLLNKNVLIEKTGQLFRLSREGQKQETLDTAFSSEKQFYFSEYSAIQNYEGKGIEYDRQKKTEIYNDNVRLINEFIKSNPQIEFDLFFPPKSVLFLKEIGINDCLDFYLSLMEKSYETFSQNDNVKIFMFQDDTQIIGNLYNYCDLKHFTSTVSDIILDTIVNEKELLNDNNYKQRIKNIKEIKDTFDYSLFDENTVTIKKCNNLDDYLTRADELGYYCAITCVNASSDEFYNTQTLLHGQTVDREKSMFEFSNNGKIKIENVTYSYGLDGINIVAYDPILKRVVDSVRFDSETQKAYPRITERRITNNSKTNDF